MASTSIYFDIYGRDKSASSTFAKVGDAAEKSSSKLSRLGGALSKTRGVAAVGLAAVGAGAVAAGKYVFNYGAKLEQMAMKAETVFGGQLGSVEAWADKTAHAMGLTTREATGLAANFADLLIPMGFTRKEAAGMATDVVGLSGALSQWSGGTKSAAEVTDILNAAMLGETDGLKALGISISAAEIETRLLKNGQDKLKGAAKQQAEAQAIQALIMEKSTDAQKAFAAGGSPLLSAQAKLKAMFGEVRDGLVAGLVPAMTTVSDWVVTKGVPAFKDFTSMLGEKLGPYVDKARDAFGSLVEKVRPVGAWFREHPEAIKGAGIALGVAAVAAGALAIAFGAVALATSPIVLIVVAIAALGAGIALLWKRSEKFRTVMTALGQALAKLPGLFMAKWREIQPQMKKLWSDVQGIIRDAMTILTESVKIGIAVVQDLWQRFGANILQYVKSSFNNIKLVLSGAFDIIRGIFKTVSALLKGDWGKAWDGIKLIVRGAAKVLRGVVGQLFNFLRFAFKNIGVALKAIWSKIWDGIKALAKAGASWLVDRIKAIPGLIRSTAGRFGEAGRLIMSKLWDIVKDKARDGGRFIVEKLREIPGKIKDLGGRFLEAGGSLVKKMFDGIRNAASGAGGLLGDVAGSFAESFKGVINNLIDKLNSLIPNEIEINNAPNINLPDNPIPHLARGTNNWRGGWAMVGEEGPEIVNLPRGSRVTPHAQSMGALRGAGGGVTVNINGPVYGDPQAFAREVRKQLLAHKRALGGELGIA